VPGRGDTARAIEAVWRIESAKLIARVTRLVGDIGTAEDIAQDTFVAALKRWPQSGVPDNPGAWLMATARFLAIDTIRRRDRLAEKHAELAPPSAAVTVDYVAAASDDIGDDLLGLMFMACHPALSSDARVTLTLRLLGGLTTAEIARAFLVSEATVAQRIVRAKRTLAATHVRFELPDRGERSTRLVSVREVIYLVFNEGYAAAAGDDWMRSELCAEAMRLGRVLVALTPDDPESHALISLMELQASRAKARTAADGQPVLLLEQNRGLWDQILIRRGLAALERVEQLGGSLGPYALQAALAACHARARRPEDTDWQRIAALYDALSQIAPSPVVEVNRAVALAMAFGPAVGLDLADELTSVPSLAGYYLLPSVRGDLLRRMGRHAEAETEFLRAASLTSNARERTLLLRRAGESSHAARRRTGDP
jgi:RNA polymerase sigma factor (sigma-70 family)